MFVYLGSMNFLFLEGFRQVCGSLSKQHWNKYSLNNFANAFMLTGQRSTLFQNTLSQPTPPDPNFYIELPQPNVQF
jgi:hypothetical protein